MRKKAHRNSSADSLFHMNVPPSNNEADPVTSAEHKEQVGGCYFDCHIDSLLEYVKLAPDIKLTN